MGIGWVGLCTHGIMVGQGCPCSRCNSTLRWLGAAGRRGCPCYGLPHCSDAACPLPELAPLCTASAIACTSRAQPTMQPCAASQGAAAGPMRACNRTCQTGCDLKPAPPRAVQRARPWEPRPPCAQGAGLAHRAATATRAPAC